MFRKLLLLDAADTPGRGYEKVFEDRADPLPALPSSSVVRDTSVKGTKSRHVSPGLRIGLYGAGSTLASLGIGLLVVHYAASSSGGYGTSNPRHVLRDWGWGSLAIGGVLIGVGI